MAQLERERRAGLHHRRFGATYLAMRREAERRLRDAFVAAGGRPERAAPHAFVLGESAWFRGLGVGMRAVQVPLSALPGAVTSATWGDAFEAMRVSQDFGVGGDPALRPHHGVVVRLDALAALVERFGLPEDGVAAGGYDGYERRPVTAYVELQLWSDEPIRHLLDQRGGRTHVR
jgi:hypothetical protein